MEDVRHFFREIEESFTIYVVEQRFAVGRGFEYFRSYKGKDNLIDTNSKMNNRITKILKWMRKKVPNLAELTKSCFSITSPLNITDVVTSLSKVFAVEEHQAAGPEVLDPIIIQEGNILPQYLAEIITLHKESILKPVIIILLKDNDFERAKELLSKCPHGINVKMIRNSGETQIYKVINCGENTPDEFIDAYARHCFSTCSNTKRDILLNEDWINDSIVRRYGPTLFQIRSFLLSDQKNEAASLISNHITQIRAEEYPNNDSDLIKAFECMLLLCRVFCNDYGGEDIYRAQSLANELHNEILKAHVWRYSFFMNKDPLSERIQLMKQAEIIFSNNRMADHAVYSKNNYLVRGFDTEKIDVRQFLSMQEEATYNTPGLVGMSHILNNTGVALLMTGSPDEAIPFFEKALDYAHSPERRVQKFAILCNIIIAKAYGYHHIDSDEMRRTLNSIFDNLGLEVLPFLTARYVMNILSVAFHSSVDLGKELINRYPIDDLIGKAFLSSTLGRNQLLLQIDFLEQHYSNFCCKIDSVNSGAKLIKDGLRNSFVLRHGYNPIFFSTWL